MKVRGFTLLEVMVALAVAGLLFIGLGAALQEQSRTAAHLQRKVAAAQVVRNQLAEATMLQEQLEEGISDGDAEMGGWPFSWQQTVSIYSTEDEMGELQQRALKLQVTVGGQGEVVEQGILYLPLKNSEATGG